jgi:hypothetical protein
MNEPCGPPWLQIHLSTAVILMFVAGLILWANCGRRHAKTIISVSFNSLTRSHATTIHEGHGFPVIWVESPVSCSGSTTTHDRIDEPEIDEPLPFVPSREWHYGALVLDVISGLVVLVATACLCEWRIRRRAAARIASPAAPR